MIETDRVDMSVPSNQNMIISTLNEFFTTDELIQIDISGLDCPANSNAIRACHHMQLENKFENGEFNIRCILDVNSKPPKHHLNLEFKKNGLYQTCIECNTNTNNPIYLANIVAKAVNVSKFCPDNHYNRRTVTERVATELADIIPDFENLIYFRSKIAQEYYTNEFYKQDDCFFTSTIEDYKIVLEPGFGNIVKFSFVNSMGDYDFVYLSRTDLGINIILLMFDKAVVSLKEQKFGDIMMDIVIS